MEISYDFDLFKDCLEEKELKEYAEKKTAIEKFIYYKEKAVPAREKYDPDLASKKLQNVYKEKWNSVKFQRFMNEKMEENSKEKICSDTMTSVLMITNRAMKLYDEKTKEKKIKEIYWADNQQHYSLKVLSEAYKTAEGKEIIERLFDSTGITRLLEMYHTIGNYCPVPCGFNGARSSDTCDAKHDFWDLTLMKIRGYYISGKEERLDELLHKKGNKEACKEWLEYFGKGECGWENFIISNYLTDYVDEDKKVKPFWKGHSWKKPLPNDLITLSIGVNEIADRIEKRGKRIAGTAKTEDKPSDTNVSKDCTPK